MKFKILISNAAKLDLIDAYDWYESQATGLGGKFQNELSNAIDELSIYPQKFQIKYSDI